MDSLSLFGRNTSGNIAILTALFLSLLFFFGGLALDYSRIYSSKSKGQQALDAATLSALRTYLLENDEGAAKEQANEIFESNLPENDNWEVEFSSVIERDNTLILGATAATKSKTTLLNIVGKKDFDISIKSEAIIPVTTLSIAVVPDISWSMRGAPLDSLKKAMSLFADSIYNLVPEFRRGLELSIVPYAGSVNISMASGNISRFATGWQYLPNKSYGLKDRQFYQDYTGRCVRIEEVFSRNQVTITEYSDTPVLQSDGISYRNECLPRVVATNPWSGCLQSEQSEFTSNNVPPRSSVKIMPPTLNNGGFPHCPVTGSEMRVDIPSAANFKRFTRTMEIGFGTAHDLGLNWARRTMEPSWSHELRTSSRPWNSDDHRKYVLFLSDGQSNNIGYSFGTYRSRTDELIENNAADICEDLKDKDVTVLSVSFELEEDPTTIEVVEDCASDDSHYTADVRNIDQLFERLADRIKLNGLYLSK